MAYEEYDYSNEPATGDISLKDALYNILDSVKNKEHWKQIGQGIQNIAQISPNVTESLSRGGVAQAIGNTGDLRDLRNTINGYLPKSVRNFTQAAEFLANPYQTAITQTAPTTEQTLEAVPRLTDTYEGYKQHETMGEYIAPGLAYLGAKALKATKGLPIGNMIAYHGTNADIAEPLNLAKVGESTGTNQGHGFYSAESPDIAKGFGKNLYKIDIPDEQIPKMMDWYKPLSEQPQEVQKALKNIGITSENVTGQDIYKFMPEHMQAQGFSKRPTEAEVSKYLNENGIKGIKYENFQIKGGKGADTNNYVSFDPAEIKLLEKNNQKLASEADELGFHSALENAVIKIGQPKGTGDQFLKQLEKTPGVKTEELDVTGVKEFLQNKPTVTKQELQNFIQESRLKLENKVLGQSTGGDVDEYRLNGGENYHDQDYIDSMAEDLHSDMTNDPDIYHQQQQELVKEYPELYEGHENEPDVAARLNDHVDERLREQAQQQSHDMYYDNPITHHYDDFGYDVYGNSDNGYTVRDNRNNIVNIGDHYDISDVEQALREHHMEQGNLDYAGGGVKYEEDYTLPGKYTNYREILTTLPSRENNAYIYASNADNKIIKKFPNYQEAFDYAQSRPQEERLANHIKPVRSFPDYQSSHYDEPNILAHMRVNDRTINGKKTLMVEEIQSDWHQAGRKEGYQGTADKDYTNYIKNLEKRYENEAFNIAVNEGMAEDKAKILATKMKNKMAENPIKLAEYFGESDKQMAMNKARVDERNLVPDAPFKKNWHELMVKQALDMAAKGDYDAVAFTTGKQQNARYNLSKQVDSIDLIPSEGDNQYVLQAWKDGKSVIRKSVKEDDLADYVGKDVADKLLAQESKDLHRPEGIAHGNPNVFQGRELKGLELDVGGEGMKGFYDKMLPDYINKYTKKWGMGMKKGHLEHEEPFSHVKLREEISNMGITPSQFDQLSSAEKKTIMNKARRLGEEVHIVDLSDSAKKDIKQKGQPLFAGIGLAAGSDYMMGPDDQKKTGIFKDLLKHKKD